MMQILRPHRNSTQEYSGHPRVTKATAVIEAISLIGGVRPSHHKLSSSPSERFVAVWFLADTMHHPISRRILPQVFDGARLFQALVPRSTQHLMSNHLLGHGTGERFRLVPDRSRIYILRSRLISIHTHLIIR